MEEGGNWRRGRSGHWDGHVKLKKIVFLKKGK